MTTTAVPETAAQFIETMLRSTIEADLLTDENINNRDLRDAHTHDCVNAFIAANALHALHQCNPEAAEQLAESLARILTAGDIAGPAWRAAKGLGHDPDQWIAAFHERAARRRAKSA